MEKYVMEALFVMGEDKLGLERMKKRYTKMVNESPFTTLYENFGDGPEGSGTNNHAWSGGGLTILSQYVCGLAPLEPAWKKFRVKPQMGNLEYAEAGNETIAGKVSVKIQKTKSGLDMELLVPLNSSAIVYLPSKYKKVQVNGSLISSDGKSENDLFYTLKGGNYKIIAK
jgi:hypothetical protein